MVLISFSTHFCKVYISSIIFLTSRYAWKVIFIDKMVLFRSTFLSLKLWLLSIYNTVTRKYSKLQTNVMNICFDKFCWNLNTVINRWLAISEAHLLGVKGHLEVISDLYMEIQRKLHLKWCGGKVWMFIEVIWLWLWPDEIDQQFYISGHLGVILGSFNGTWY